MRKTNNSGIRYAMKMNDATTLNLFTFTQCVSYLAVYMPIFHSIIMWAIFLSQLLSLPLPYTPTPLCRFVESPIEVILQWDSIDFTASECKRKIDKLLVSEGCDFYVDEILWGESVCHRWIASQNNVNTTKKDW